MSTLSLNEIIDVTISLGPVNKVRTHYNVALIMGSSGRVSAEERTKEYSDTRSMISDGWTAEDPEYDVASLYFAQRPKPGKVVIGCYDETEDLEPGTALQKCRESNSEWYVSYFCDADDEDILALAEATEGMAPDSVYAFTTDDPKCIGVDVNTSIIGKLMEKNYRRTIGQYSNQDHAVMAIIGYAMGANEHTANSAFTLMAKKEIGVVPDTITSTELARLKSNNCNVYINRGSVYDLFEDGVMVSGVPFDEVLFLDMMVNEIQSTAIGVLQSNAKIAQTDQGVASLLNELAEPLEKYRAMGVIAPGTWKAPDIMSLKTGDILERGYVLIAEPIAEQSQSDREKRKAPPIYIPIKLAGAIESMTIRAYVNR